MCSSSETAGRTVSRRASTAGCAGAGTEGAGGPVAVTGTDDAEGGGNGVLGPAPPRVCCWVGSWLGSAGGEFSTGGPDVVCMAGSGTMCVRGQRSTASNATPTETPIEMVTLKRGHHRREGGDCPCGPRKAFIDASMRSSSIRTSRAHRSRRSASVSRHCRSAEGSAAGSPLGRRLQSTSPSRMAVNVALRVARANAGRPVSIS